MDRSRLTLWLLTGLVTAVVVIAASVAALDRHILSHEWSSDAQEPPGIVVLAPDHPGAYQPGGSGRAEGGSARRRSLQRATGGTVAEDRGPDPTPRSRRRDDAPAGRPESGRNLRVRAPVEPVPPAVVRTLPEDRDGDGLTDRVEERLGTDPNSDDTDADTLPDAWEEQYGLDPTSAGDAETDADGDGLLNRTEYRVRSNPRELDTNSDGTPDGADDADGDALPNAVEQELAGADPANADTNGDGQDDGADDEDGDGVANADEVTGGTDPAVPDAPVVVEEPPAGQTPDPAPPADPEPQPQPDAPAPAEPEAAAAPAEPPPPEQPPQPAAAPETSP
jgi:thrombospondin type 3 repeat protein